MRTLRVLLVYLAFVFIGAALLSPLLYKLVHSLSNTYPWLEGLREQPFHRYVNRCMLLLALLGMWPFLQRIGIDFSRPAESSRSTWATLFARGLSIGLASLLFIGLIELGVGARVLHPERTASQLLAAAFSGLLTALVVSLIEETLFRKGLFVALQKEMPLVYAALLSSLVYALVHFFHRPASPAQIEWTSGFATLAGMLKGFAHFRDFVPAFFNLTFAGMILAIYYARKGSLAISIGIHAGWIFWLKFWGVLTDNVQGISVWIWGSSRLIDGWLAFAVLAAMLSWIMSKRPTKRPIPESHAI